MLKNGLSYTEIRQSTFKELSFLVNLHNEYAKQEEKLIKQAIKEAEED